MSLLSRLFGGGQAKTTADVRETYQDMQILPEPMAEGNVYRLRARITQDKDGQSNEHVLIRADTFQDRDAAIAAAITKAKQMIDEQGERLFD
ncbi:HlyU family transcriptional regulator [Cognatiyoonia sp. IB215182]|uniref:HlyU family transcriptional regulator n=1 Tax=Cognatiyoonia sp. IB215182 TaxID=3097353 RepID=UPI002A0B0E5E|nr:HlyU family transcriptional regulator [Cognatiyoonia sp. IB215182]MDX8354404.1 HlyU family transcriptional regulator [Cognatiyoonia sp. IB215182]